MSLLYTSLALLVVAAGLYKILFSKPTPPYPPSPPADFLIGHARFIPQDNQAVYFHHLRQKYGNIIYLNVLGKTMIILNSTKTAVDLLDKRGLNYSDRPRLVMLSEIVAPANFASQSYTKKTIKQRSLMAPLFTRTVAKNYEPIQLREAQLFANNLVRKPQDFIFYVRKFTVAVIMEIAYGYHIERDDDHYIELADGVSKALVASGPPGSTPPDILPILKYLPAWFPGAWWSKYGKEHRPTVEAFLDLPFQEVVKQMAEGTAKPSFVRNLREDLQSSGEITKEEDEELKSIAGLIYGAGAETTWSSINVFFYAMLLFPEAQKRAQREIDTVIGSGQLPTFSDRGLMPYLECLMQEVLRWNPVIPLGIPHLSREADMYENFFIPKGAMIVANTYGIGHDPDVYSDADAFKPERYLPKPDGAGEPFPSATFGFGRRVCPGQWFAESNIWMIMAYTLSVFDILPVIGADGKEIVPEPEFTSTFTSQPKPFKCNIVPRSAGAIQLIEQAVEK